VAVFMQQVQQNQHADAHAATVSFGSVQQMVPVVI